jgi:hypothetical protein
MLRIDAVQDGLRMTPRWLLLAAVALAGLLRCYVSHADFSDASSSHPDDGRDDGDCQAACLAEASGPTFECPGVGRGLCTRGYRWAGCYCWLEHGPAEYETCWN